MGARTGASARPVAGRVLRVTAHSHDNVDWDARLRRLRADDEFTTPEITRLVQTLLLPTDRTVVEVGSGAGGTAAKFASTLAQRDAPAGTVTVVDSAPQLLAEATRYARCSAAARVEVRGVRADAAAPELVEAIDEPADLVYAAFAVHHLPDQVAGLRRLARLARPNGRVAIVETGLSPRVLPWDVGVGEPALEERLVAATNNDWFRQLRADMPGAVPMPFGWGRALSEAGLVDVDTWTYLVDRPAPVDDITRDAVLRRLNMLRNHAEDRVAAEDLNALDRLLDPADEQFVGGRDDVYYLAANTVIVGRVPEAS